MVIEPTRLKYRAFRTQGRENSSRLWEKIQKLMRVHSTRAVAKGIDRDEAVALPYQSLYYCASIAPFTFCTNRIFRTILSFKWTAGKHALTRPWGRVHQCIKKVSKMGPNRVRCSKYLPHMLNMYLIHLCNAALNSKKAWGRPRGRVHHSRCERRYHWNATRLRNNCTHII